MDDSTLMAYQGLQAAAGTIGSIATGTLNYKNSKKLMKYQYDLNQQAIDAQNLYNLPINQVQRLRDAKLNPNLVYGSGDVVGNTSSSANVGLGRSDMPDLGKYVMQNNLAMQQAQIANIEADTHLKDEQANNQVSQRLLNDTKEQYLTEVTSWYDASFDLRLETMQVQKDLTWCLRNNAVITSNYLEMQVTNLESVIAARNQVTEQTLLTMAQARDMQIKAFDFQKEQWREKFQLAKEQNSIAWKNASAYMIVALASKMQGEAALKNANTNARNATTNAYNARTQREYLQLAKAKFAKMSDAELENLYQDTLNKVSYRENILNYQGIINENRALLMGSQTDLNQGRLIGVGQSNDMVVPNMFMDFLDLGF